MNLTFLRPLTRLVGRASLTVQKFSPEIMTGIGIAGGITAAVLASKATLKLDKEIEPIKADIQAIKSYPADKDYARDITQTYFRGAVKIVRHYAIPLSIGAVSIAAILVGHGMLLRRNAALVAAYNTVELAYQAYREKVRDEFGVEKDSEILGKAQKEVSRAKAKPGTPDDEIPSLPSGHARFFDRYNPNWNAANKSLNLFFLKCQQTYLNDQLRVRGHLTLNEVYDALGFDRTSDGLILGWVIGKGKNNFVDFGIYNPENERGRAFVNGDEDAILLDFNIDGVIWDKF